MVDLGKELSNSTLITSKTDLKGKVVYCNKDFIEYSGYKEDEIFGKVTALCDIAICLERFLSSCGIMCKGENKFLPL